MCGGYVRRGRPVPDGYVRSMCGAMCEEAILPHKGHDILAIRCGRPSITYDYAAYVVQ